MKASYERVEGERTDVALDTAGTKGPTTILICNVS